MKGTILQVAHAQLALQISIPVPSCTGTVVPRSRCVLDLATTSTTWTLPEHQALTPRTPRAVGSPLVPDPDQGEQTRQSRSQASSLTKPTSGARVLTDQSDCSKPRGRHQNLDITGRLFKLTSRSKYAHMAVG